MGANVRREGDGCVVVTMEGVFEFADLVGIQEAAKGMKVAEKVNCLVLAGGFAGWGKGGDWGDLTFMHKADPMINKIAVVAEGKWEEELMMFLGAGRRQAEVEFFFEDEEDDARDWLAEG